MACVCLNNTNIDSSTRVRKQRVAAAVSCTETTKGHITYLPYDHSNGSRAGLASLAAVLKCARIQGQRGET